LRITTGTKLFTRSRISTAFFDCEKGMFLETQIRVWRCIDMRTKTYTDDTFSRARWEAALVKGVGFDSVEDHVTITDDDGVILYVNRAAEQHTGYDCSEMIGKTPGELWGNNMDKDFYENMWRTIKVDKKLFVGRIQNTRKDGTKYYADWRIYPVVDSVGKISCFIGLSTDITAKVEEEKHQDEIMSILAHQIKSPFTAELVLLNLLKSDKKNLTQNQSQLIDQTLKSHEVLTALIQDFLLILRLKEDFLALSKKDKPLDPIFKSVFRELKPFAENKKINLVLKGMPSAPIYVPYLLHKILHHVILNAIVYSHKGSNVFVEVKKRSSGGLVITCKDSGIGIAKEDYANIFTPLFRAQNAVAHVKEGTGLGLYIAKNIADGLGYKISFKSDTEKGTVVTIEIPK
jgi:PAS domain S-box-containing protein